MFDKIKKRAFEEGYKAGYAVGKATAEKDLIAQSIDSYNKGFFDGTRAKMPAVLDACFGKSCVKRSRGRRKNVRTK